jgi:hypothetical protein
LRHVLPNCDFFQPLGRGRVPFDRVQAAPAPTLSALLPHPRFPPDCLDELPAVLPQPCRCQRPHAAAPQMRRRHVAAAGVATGSSRCSESHSVASASCGSCAAAGTSTASGPSRALRTLGAGRLALKAPTGEDGEPRGRCSDWSSTDAVGPRARPVGEASQSTLSRKLLGISYRGY